MSTGSPLNRTPAAVRRSTSPWMSRVTKAVAGTPASYSAFWYSRAGGNASGSRTSSTPSTPSGEVTVSHRYSPTGTSSAFTKPRTSV